MTLRVDMEPWVLEAIHANGGEAEIDSIAEFVWTHHEGDLRRAPRGLWTWQYEMRWAGDNLVKQGKIEKLRGTWRISR